jgi:catechol 2,3-dioxygenase
MLTMGATLNRLVLSSPQVECVCAFYRDAFGYQLSRLRDAHRCDTGESSIWFRSGPANQLLEAHWQFAAVADFRRFSQRLADGGVACDSGRDADGEWLSLTDPAGCGLRFHCQPSLPSAPSRGPIEQRTPRPARLQHYAVRCLQPEALARFYIEQLGFVASDWVHDAQGVVSAVFLRTDAEHHALAIFKAPEQRFDHFSCETRDWSSLRDWADHIAAVRHQIAWGIGRHGPGNDNFFMVYDPDGNLAEISCDLEVCPDDRAAGRWVHEPRTLNLWGAAIMRS